MEKLDMTLVGRTGQTLTGGLIKVLNVRQSPWDTGVVQVQVSSLNDATRPPWWVATSGVVLDPTTQPTT